MHITFLSPSFEFPHQQTVDLFRPCHMSTIPGSMAVFSYRLWHLLEFGCFRFCDDFASTTSSERCFLKLQKKPSGNEGAPKRSFASMNPNPNSESKARPATARLKSVAGVNGKRVDSPVTVTHKKSKSNIPIANIIPL